MSFTKRSEHTVYEGRVISTVIGTFVAPDGTEFERELVHHPGAVSVVPLIGDRTVLMVRQYRASIDAPLLEIPAGKRDVPGEEPEDTARRELVEEIGYEADHLDLLGRFHNSPGFSDELSFVYLARGLEHVGSAVEGVEEAHMSIEAIHLDDVPALIEDGELVDAKSIIGLLLARDRLGS